MRHPAAFTLVELLVALTLTAMVSAATIGIVRSVSGARQRVEEQMDLQQEARTAVSAIATCLRNAHRSKDNLQVLEGKDDWRGDMPADRIRLLTVRQAAVRADQPESDVKEVEFALVERHEGEMPALARRLDPTRNEQPDGGGVLDRLARNVVALDIQYHDSTQWRDDWPVSQSWPLAIRLRLAVVSDGVPPRHWEVSRLVSFPAMPAIDETSESQDAQAPEAGGTPSQGAQPSPGGDAASPAQPADREGSTPRSGR